LPGDSSIVPISFTPSDTQVSGVITFSSNANTGSQTASVPLTANIIQPAKFHLSLSSPDSGKDGQKVTFYLILSGTNPANVVSAINFDFIENSDLLTFVSVSGAGLAESGSAPLHFTYAWGSASSLPDTIGAVTFRVYLTDSSATPLTLSNITFEDTLGLPPDCIASIDSAGTNFTYIYQCGNNLLQNELLGLPIPVLQIIPDPATGSITVKGSAGPFTIFDPLGRSYQMPGMANTLDISSLPSGVYFVSDGLSRAKFVKE
jgi:hypothetical protein